MRADPEVTIVQTPTDTGLPTYLPPDPTGRYARIVVSTRHDYGTDEAKKLAARFRHRYVPGRASARRVYAGGGPPAGVDFINRAYGVFPWLVLGVLAVTYLVLMRAFRSLLLPLKAVILNLLSVGATYGLLVIAFRWGFGGIIGLPQANQIEAWIPMFLFAMLFGLSMDYEVFLLSRMRELYDETGDTERAVALGLMRTGRIVTAAAAIMVAAFSGFMLGSLIGLVQFGFGLAGDHDRRDDHPRAARARAHEADGRVELVPAWIALLCALMSVSPAPTRGGGRNRAAPQGVEGASGRRGAGAG